MAQTITVTTAADPVTGTPGGRAEVHLGKLTNGPTQQPPGLPVQRAGAGKQFVTTAMTVRNMGDNEFDTYPLSAPQRWASGGGQVTSPSIAVGGETFTDQPEPHSGQRVIG